MNISYQKNMYKIKINDTQTYEFAPETGTVLLTEVERLTNNGPEAYIKTKPIANFWPIVIARVEVKEDDNIRHFAKCKLEFPNGDVIENVDIPIDGIKKLDWLAQSPRCILNPDVSKANEHLANIILFAYPDAPLETATIVNRNRLYVVDGIPLYHVGDRLINPDEVENEPNVIFKPMPNIRLVIDPECSEKEVFAGMMRIINLCKVNEILHAFNLLYIQRDAFIKVGITPKSCILLHSPTGWKKTTVGNFITQIYNRDKPLEPPSRLDSSIAAAVNRLYEHDNVVVMLDDLMEEGQENILHQTLRIIGDGIEPGRMRGHKLAKSPPRCGLLYTGEYYFNRGWGSDAARIIPLKLDAPINSDRLSECQREPLMLSTFMDYYIRWFVNNYETVCGLLKEWTAAYRNTKASVHPRLEEQQACLEMSMKLFLTYAESKGFITSEVAQHKYYSYYNHLRGIIKEQDARVNKTAITTPKEIKYLEIIQMLCRNGRFSLARSVKDFSEKDDDGVLKTDYICFRKEKLLKKIKVVEPAATLDEMIDYLKSRNILRVDKDSTTRKLHGSKLRFLFVRRNLM